MDHAEPKGSLQKEWYYELGGRVHGPVSRSVLEDLLGRSGDTAIGVRVREGADGPWRSFQADAAKVVASSPIPSDPGVPARAATPRARPAGRTTGRARRAIWMVWRHLPKAAAIGVWVLANVCLLFFWPQPHGAERRAVLALEEIDTKMTDLRRTRVSEEDWNAFCQRSKVSLAPIVRDLQSAERSEPVQILLVACRDIVPKLCGPQNPQRQNEQWRLKRCIQRVDLVLSGLDTD